MTAHDAVVVPSGRNLDVELNRPDRKRPVSAQIKDEEIVAALQNQLVAAINEDNAKKLKTGQITADDGGNDKKRMKRTHPNAPEHIQIDRSHVQPDAAITSGLKTPIFDSAADRSGSLQSASTDSNSGITDPVSASSTSSSAHPSLTRPPASSLKRELTPTSVPLPTPQPQQSSHVRRPSLKREPSMSSSSLSVSQPPQPLYYYPSCGLSPSEWSPIFNFSSVLSSSSYPSIQTTSDSEKLQLKTLNLPVAPTGSKLLLEKEYDVKGVFPKSIHTVIKDIPKCIEFEYPERNKMMSELRGMGMSAYVEIQDVAKSLAVTYLILSPFEVKPQEYRIAGYIVDSQLILERINRRVVRLLGRNMLPLVLDLDDTLVRVVGDQGNGARFVDDKETGQYDDRMRSLPDGRKVVLTRGVHEFLNWCKDKFEVSICSLGDPTYVNAIKQILDPKGDTIQGIVYSARQEFDYLLYLTQVVHKKDTQIPPTPSVAVPPSSTTAVTSPPPTPISEVPPTKSKITVSLEIPPKNLDALFPFCHVKDPHFQGHGYTLPLILDDRIDTWPVQQQNNVILVQESLSSQPWNVNLHHIQPILAEIHSTFFSQYDKYRRKQQWGGYAGRIRSATVLEGKMRTAHVPDVRDVLGLHLRRMLAEKVANGDAHAKANAGKREIEEGEVKNEDGEIGGDVGLKPEPQTSSPFPSQSQLFHKSRGQQYPTAPSKFPNRNPGPGQPHKRKKKRNRDRIGGPDSRNQPSRPDTSSYPPSLSSSSSQLPGLHRHESRSRSTSQSEVGVSRSGTNSRNPSRESSVPNVPGEKESVVVSSESKEVNEETPLPVNSFNEQDTASVQSNESKSKVNKALVGEIMSTPVAVNVEKNSTSVSTRESDGRKNPRSDFMMTEPIVEKKEKIEIEARVDTGSQKSNTWSAGGVKYAEVKVEREVSASEVNQNRYQDRNVWSDGSTHHRETVEPKREFPLFPNTGDRRASSTERLLEIQPSSASTVQQPHHPETVNRGHGYQPYQSTQPGQLSQGSSRQMSPPPPASLWHDSKSNSQYRPTPGDQPVAGSAVSSQYHQTRDFRRPSTDYGYSSQHPSSYQPNQSQAKAPSSSTDWPSYYPPSSSSMSSSTQPSQSRSSRPYLPPPASLDSIINQPIPTKPSPMPPYSQSSSSVNYGGHPLTDRERERPSLPMPSSYSFPSSRTPVSNAHAQPSHSNPPGYIPLHQQNQPSHISLPSRSQHASSTPVNTNVQSHRPSAGYTQSQYDQRTQYTDNRYQSSYPPPPTQQQQQHQQQHHSPHHRPIDNQPDQNNYRQPQHNQPMQYPPQQNQNQNQQNHGTSYQYYNYQR